MADTKKRSWAKSATWRVLGFFILFPIVLILNGGFEDALAVTIVFNIIRFILYFFHERAWEKLKWGKNGS